MLRAAACIGCCRAARKAPSTTHLLRFTLLEKSASRQCCSWALYLTYAVDIQHADDVQQHDCVFKPSMPVYGCLGTPS